MTVRTLSPRPAADHTPCLFSPRPQPRSRPSSSRPSSSRPCERQPEEGAAASPAKAAPTAWRTSAGGLRVREVGGRLPPAPVSAAVMQAVERSPSRAEPARRRLRLVRLDGVAVRGGGSAPVQVSATHRFSTRRERSTGSKAAAAASAGVEPAAQVPPDASTGEDASLGARDVLALCLVLSVFLVGALLV